MKARVIVSAVKVHVPSRLVKQFLNPIGKLWASLGKQAIKFCTVGGANVILSSAILYSLTEYGHTWYLYSNWVAVVVGQVFAFLGYKYWAFTLDNGRAAYGFWKQFVIHWTVWGMGLVISTVVIYSLTTYGHVWYMFSSWVATAISGASNFLSHRYWTYMPDKTSLSN